MTPFSRMFFTFIIIIFTFFMIINPQETVKASADGFKLWYSVLLPALLPFFIAAELLVSLKFTNFLSLILEPVMRPLFRLPGSSALVIVMGFTSGFPVGAILSKKLYDSKMLTEEETERLVSFTNNSSPLFIIGAIGVGMLSAPILGYLLAFSHYAANLLVGLVLKFKAPLPLKTAAPPALRFNEALKTISEIPSHGIGRLVGDAVQNSINNILTIAGFIIIFSVFTRMLIIWGIMDIFAHSIVKILSFTGLNYHAAYGIGIGIFEITLGTKTVAASNIDIISQLIIISILLSFSGLSIIAQVMSAVAGTKVRLAFYLKARFMQMLFSALFTYTGYIWLASHSNPVASFSFPSYKILYSFDAFRLSINCLITGSVIIALLMLISLIKEINLKTKT
ncbi:sporulation integral membrane protein YlbJ [Thermosyntropha sp.]|uniref:sporulation integral membrane protein YlbJ n=1 Tax=Thermosyntropha sp. TaxID=2740820 RepID=UPI0025E4848A|nr:sporulation integral membrane protein YlbJ [Thermosyntropha sp.]MBO8159448.1 sporulation integral membrane protein YlbJ [Thermosyntropha sp.]